MEKASFTLENLLIVKEKLEENELIPLGVLGVLWAVTYSSLECDPFNNQLSTITDQLQPSTRIHAHAHTHTCTYARTRTSTHIYS